MYDISHNEHYAFLSERRLTLHIWDSRPNHRSTTESQRDDQPQGASDTVKPDCENQRETTVVLSDRGLRRCLQGLGHVCVEAVVGDGHDRSQITMVLVLGPLCRRVSVRDRIDDQREDRAIPGRHVVGRPVKQRVVEDQHRARFAGRRDNAVPFSPFLLPG